MTTPIRIVIADPSPIIRLGLENQLKKLPRYKVQIACLAEDGKRDWEEMLAMSPADVFMLNPVLCGLHPRALLPQTTEAKLSAINYGTIDDDLLKAYDGVLRITDNMQRIAELFDKLIEHDDKAHGESQDLTAREREIVICVVKGMTNKRIAEHLFLSTHTVITHRRNIGKKLQIHSAGALAVYAIMNKLIDPRDINVLSKDAK